MRETRDIVRQVVVAASAVIAIAGSFVGSGAAGGTPIQNAAGGALSATATPIAPAGPAFAIWSVIYLGLVAYAVWQLLPKQSGVERHRRLGYWIAASLILNAGWILSVQFNLLVLSVPVIALLLAVLGVAFGLCLTLRPTSAVDAIVTDGTVGLYLERLGGRCCRRRRPRRCGGRHHRSRAHRPGPRAQLGAWLDRSRALDGRARLDFRRNRRGDRNGYRTGGDCSHPCT
jgi:hypothetical protein